ncbi:D-alanine--D-alanine ligase N-terminal [Bacteriovorax sp. BAL6_X]|uniref:D-alanine--D-alanine ligase n=1 Tax=Bacteriovorax sp. BAL6_X TaxID=1201290 RepID=UPI000386BDC7|nr:D-alanine--D-alanine ligase [Bacteriovorax sp. BAL6_X]EPZ50843.1 D-alanine--D-alanine ligase N-terminal [Bacteriovorax sp. BAL6_X]
MERKNILIICGGGSTEHEVSLRSAAFVKEQVALIQELNPIVVEMTKTGEFTLNGHKVSLNGQILETATERPYINYVIPVIHGPPGETGEIQSFLEMHKLPYFGPRHEGSSICFNKVSTKLWFDHLGIPNTQWMSIHKDLPYERSEVVDFFEKSNNDVFIKAASQGSSVGCYHVTNREDLIDAINKALEYSDDILIERTVKGRELEIAVFEQDGNLHASRPGEIVNASDEFYDYEQKYSDQSKAKTFVEAPDLTNEQVSQMQIIAKTTFKCLKLRHLSRIDFFLSEGNIYLNEINTFPGMTSISMFPKMLENTGLKFSDFLKEKILKEVR